MPTKKNARKRARDNTADSSGPPKKRMKKVKQKSTSLRRSARSHSKPKEYWKVDDDDNNENDDDSDDIYLPATRRTRSDRSNKQNTNKNTKSTKPKQSKPNKKTNSKKKPSQNQETSEISLHSDSESNNNNNNYIDIDILSPHQKQIIHDLPQKIDAMIASQQNHSKMIESLLLDEMNKDVISIHLHSIKNILTKSDSLKKKQCDIAKQINLEYIDLTKNGDIQREELNKNIENINTKHISLKKSFEKEMELIHEKMEKFNNLNKTENKRENEYQILYETSLKKIEMLNKELMDLKHEIKLKNEERFSEDKKRENERIETENKQRKEILNLNSKYLVEIDDLKVQIKCSNNEFDEFREKMNEHNVINDNNDNLLISNLKRENKALLTELAQYRQSEGTLTPHSRINTPINTNYKDYTKHIQDSPLNQRIQTELISISNIKNLENERKNLNEEIASYKKQLFAKKELINEFQDLLQESHIQQKQMLSQREKDMKIINVFEILTSSKIEEKEEKQNIYKCRTIYKENESMLEYDLSLNGALCDYCLISSHNLEKPLNESLADNITFYCKDAPLFLKSLIQEVFIQK